MSDESPGALLGRSSAMRKLRNLIFRIAPTSLPVLVEGETGVGKELVVQEIHRISRRRGRLVALNVAAVPEELFEASLFGHARGAFTGATAENPGYLAEANSGTLFLDEIGTLRSSLQPKLLRVLETGDYRPVGGRNDLHSDFRLTVATNEDLNEAVAIGLFRADLRQRFGSAMIHVPPLRDRVEDIPELVASFLTRLGPAYGGSRRITENAMHLLLVESWPGNVRQLKLVIECAALLADSTDIGQADIRAALGCRSSSPHSRAEERIFARRRLLSVLERFEWDVASAARELGINRATVYRRMTKFAIVCPSKSSPPDSGYRPTSIEFAKVSVSDSLA